MSTFFPPRVVILVVVQSNVPLRTCFWPLYWTSSLCRCELMPVLLWNFYTGRMQITASWGLWKHPNPVPGGRPRFFKPEWPKESKNEFKTISSRRYRIVFFSNYFFRYLKSSKKWNGFTSNWFPDNLNSIKCSIDPFFDIRTN